MRKSISLLALFVFAFSPSAGQSQKSQPVAFIHVNVVPMDRERIIENQTVIIRDGRIVEIGPSAKVKIPQGALRIEAQGKYLMPGLAEMHGHLPNPNQGEAVTQSFLTLFVANGVTTVRGMFGFPNHPSLRDRIARGEVLGPRLYAASPALSGQSVPNADEAERLVRKYKQDGFDLLKVHEGLSVEAYERIVKVAGEVGIRLGGHIANDVGLERALKARQSSIEHIDGYLEAVNLDTVDDNAIKKLAAMTRDAEVWVTGTMVLWQTFNGSDTPDSLRAQRAEVKYMPPQMLNQWTQQRNNQMANLNPQTGQKVISFRDRMLKALADAGVKILLGSDAPQLFSVPGFSLHREMQAMRRVGLTPYQILETGTRNAAIYLNAEKEFGTIEVGKWADLILVDDNPLKDVSNVARRAGVMLRGKWLPESELRRMLDQIATSYAQ
ncbi:MAG: amidohydrolase family protein [Acidobacteriota bacterium]